MFSTRRARISLFRKLGILLITLAALINAPGVAFAASGSNTLFLPAVQTTFAANAAAAADSPGGVYVLTNQSTGNGVAVFKRAADGTLTLDTIVPTGGFGLGAALGSQGAVMISDNGRQLFAVNAGSNEVSAFAVTPGGLVLTNKVASGGVRPTSLTYHKGLLYVLNAGGSGNISGFTVDNQDKITPLAGSTRPLSADGTTVTLLASQIAFNPDGSVLVVTERGTSKIDTYTIDSNGLASGLNVQSSSGPNPFGFAFAKQDTLVVSEASGSAVSSYAVSATNLTPVSLSIANGQVAACWIAISKNGKYAYSANAGSASVSSYGVAADGTLTLIQSVAGSTGDNTAPVDEAISHNGQYLYVLSARSQNVIGFAVQADGSLLNLGTFGGLPTTPAGIAAW